MNSQSDGNMNIVSTEEGKKGIDVSAEIYDLYKHGMNRVRWFLLTSVTISVAILLLTYVENYSIQKAQFINSFAQRVLHISKKLQSSEPTSTAADPKDSLLRQEYRKSNLPLLAEEYLASKRSDLMAIKSERISDLSKEDTDKLTVLAHGIYNETLAKQTFDDLRIKDESIPLLGMNVPHNDFIPILLSMLVILVIGTWLSLRSTLGALMALNSKVELEAKEKSRLKLLMRLNFTFSGLSPSSSVKIHSFVRLVAIFLPAISILLAGWYDAFGIVISMFRNGTEIDPFFGPYILFRFVIMLLSLFIVAAFCIENNRHSKTMTKIATEGIESAPAASSYTP